MKNAKYRLKCGLQYVKFEKTSKYFVKIAPKTFIFTFISNRDSLDWKDYGTDSIVKTVTEHKHLGNGSIILLHNGTTYTKDALEPMIEKLLEQGYMFKPVSELILTKDYEIDHEGRQHAIRKE